MRVQEILGGARRFRRGGGDFRINYRSELSDGRELVATFVRRLDGQLVAYEFEFRVGDEYDLSDAGLEFEVFGVVVAIIRDFVGRTAVDALLWGAEEADARDRLYRRIFSRVGDGWRLVEPGEVDALPGELGALLRRRGAHDSQYSWSVAVRDGVELEESLRGGGGFTVRSGADWWRAEGVVEGELMRFGASRRTDDTWEIDFSRVVDGRPRYGLTGAGVPFRILSWVAACLEQFLAEVAPAGVLFSYDGAERSPGVYDRLMRRAGWEHARSWSVGETGVDRLYVRAG